jgi:pimeloyl-ACP methyl ester carboxylesterase
MLFRWNLVRSDPVLKSMRTIRSVLCAISLSACLLLAQAAGDSGRIIAIAGRQVHVSVAGRGRPAVIFEAGFMNDLQSWAKVQPEVAKSCATVSYDRPGIGGSQETPLPRTGEQIAKDLHAALQQLGVPPPYILVGHSAGGLYIRSFARQYPNEVAGMVFVDAVLPEYLRWLRANDVEHWQQLERIGAESGNVVRAQWQGLEPTLKEVEGGGPLPRVPIAVLVSDQSDLPFKPPTAMPAFLRTQREFVAQLPGAKIEIIAAGHELPSLTPEKVTAAIFEVVNKAKLASQ